MAKIICAGLGPGDLDLMSVKAYRLVSNARKVAYFRKKGHAGIARTMAAPLLQADVVEMAMEYPVTTEIPFDSPEYNRLLAEFYDAWAERLAQESGEVVVLCEGDPFFFGSFMHLYTRLKPRVPVDVVAGIPGMVGCWNQAGIPMTWGDDVLSVLAATLPEPDLERHCQQADAIVIMKAGRYLDKIRAVLGRLGLLDRAWLVENGTMPHQKLRPLAEVDGRAAYFSLILVHGQGRRPELAP